VPCTSAVRAHTSVLNRKASRLDALEGANLRKAATRCRINPYKGVKQLQTTAWLGQVRHPAVVEVLDGARNLSPRKRCRAGLFG